MATCGAIISLADNYIGQRMGTSETEERLCFTQYP